MTRSAKVELYHKLAEKRKECRLCSTSVENYSQRPNACSANVECLSFSEAWQSNLSPKIMLIDSEGGFQISFDRRSGQFDENLPFIRNLRILLNSIGFDPGTPSDPKHQPLFFYSLPLCFYRSRLSDAERDRTSSTCAEEFLPKAVDLLRPKVIICVGAKVFKQTARVLGGGKVPSLAKHISEGGPVLCPDFDTSLFGVFSFNGLGEQKRSIEAQVEDWRRIGTYHCFDFHR